MEKLFNTTNEEFGISGFVLKGNSGKYHAILHDDDANKNIGIFICEDFNSAISKCKEFVA